MSRITKEKAEMVAKKIAQPLREKYISAHQEKRDAAYKLYKDTLPEELLKVFEKFPAYINTTNNVKFTGRGFNYESSHITESLPSSKYGGYPTVELYPIQAKYLRILFDKVEKLKKNYDELVRDLEIAIYELKTYKRCEEEFPQAFKHLPSSQSTALTINLNDLKKRLPK